MGDEELGNLLSWRRVTSENYDTGLAIDWPHYCTHATSACGGNSGYCYTFSGYQTSQAHHRHVAMVDALARRVPELFARAIDAEVSQAVNDGRIRDRNLRYSGSGEISQAHIPALLEVLNRGVHLWGFTRDPELAIELRRIGASAILSCDRETGRTLIEFAAEHEIPLAYVSQGIDDQPPPTALVVFPVHKGGRVAEVVDHPALCPKVLSDFFTDSRPRGSCQTLCQRCHLRETDARS